MIEDLEAYLANPDWYNNLFREMGLKPPKISKVKKILEQLDG